MMQEYTFTEEELKQAKTLNSLQVMYLNTKFALFFKQKAATMVPTTSLDDREFLLTMGKLEGKLELLQEMFDECKEAQTQIIIESNTQQTNQQNTAGLVASMLEIRAIEERSAGMVHDIKQV